MCSYGLGYELSSIVSDRTTGAFYVLGFTLQSTTTSMADALSLLASGGGPLQLCIMNTNNGGTGSFVNISPFINLTSGMYRCVALAWLKLRAVTNLGKLHLTDDNCCSFL